jgi:hypothetical protein
MKVIDIKEGKTFYHLRITRAGQIYGINEVTVEAICGNTDVIFQIIYSMKKSSLPYTLIYTLIYQNLSVEESDSPYFIKMGPEEYLTLPNKQALMKAVKTQMMTNTPSVQYFTKTSSFYKNAMIKIKSLH